MNPSFFIDRHLKHWMRQCGISLRDLSERSHIKTNFLSDFLEHRKGASVRTIDRLARVFGVTRGQFTAPYRLEKRIYEDTPPDKESYVPCGYERALAIVGADYLTNDESAFTEHGLAACRTGQRHGLSDRADKCAGGY